jgi:hypothetical protein
MVEEDRIIAIRKSKMAVRVKIKRAVIPQRTN